MYRQRTTKDERSRIANEDKGFSSRRKDPFRSSGHRNELPVKLPPPPPSPDFIGSHPAETPGCAKQALQNTWPQGVSNGERTTSKHTAH